MFERSDWGVVVGVDLWRVVGLILAYKCEFFNDLHGVVDNRMPGFCGEGRIMPRISTPTFRFSPQRVITPRGDNS